MKYESKTDCQAGGGILPTNEESIKCIYRYNCASTYLDRWHNLISILSNPEANVTSVRVERESGRGRGTSSGAPEELQRS